MRVQTAGGEVIELGTTETAPTIGIIDFSRRVTDDFGVTTVVERGFARRMSVRLAVPFEAVDVVQRQLADLRATAATWIADDRFGSLSIEGFYKDFEIDLAVPPMSYCTLTVEGLTETDPVADTGADPAVEGQASTLRLLQPVTVDNGVLAASSVPEDDAPAWAAEATYAAGARVVTASTHRVHESLINGNTGFDPASTSGKWFDVGPTNRWAMFDQALGTATIASTAIELTLTPSIATTALAILDTNAATVRVRAAGYDRTQDVNDAGKVLFFGLTVAAGASVLVTLTPAPPTASPRRWDDGASWIDEAVWRDSRAAGDGTITVGTFLVGQVKGLGVTEASPTAGITDFSRKTVDDFGEVSVVPRAWAKRMTARALIRTASIDQVAARITAVRARPSLWIGQEGVDSLTVYGFFKEFSIEVGEGVSKLSLTIEGLSTATPLVPLVPETLAGLDPAAAAAIEEARAVAAAAAAGVERSGETLIRASLASYSLRQRAIALTHLDGLPLGTVVIREVQERIDGDRAIVETMDLIGVKTRGGTAFVLNSALVVAIAGDGRAVTLGTMVARIGSTEAAITREAEVRASADAASAQTITALTTKVGENSASITTFTEARVVGGNTFVKAGFEADNNGVITGIYFTADGTTAALKMTLDELTIYRPGTNTAAPTANDLLFSLDGTKLRLRDVVVDSIEIASVGPAELASGATGEGALFFDANPSTVSSQSAWTNIAGVSITSKHGKPIKVDFTMFARNISDPETHIALRVVRDDGTPVYGGFAGHEMEIKKRGSLLALRCVDSPIKDRPNTYTLQGKKTQSNDVVSFTERVVMAEEQSRIHFQNYSVVSAEPGTGPGGGPGGGGGTGGSGGGGGTYNPNIIEAL